MTGIHQLVFLTLTDHNLTLPKFIMKVFIAIIALTLAVSSQASYIPEAAYPSWPVSYNAWPQANVAAWNDHSYVNSWSSAWAPSYGYDNGLYGYKANSLNSAYSWGLPWGTYGNAAGVYGWGHKGGYLSSVPVSKQIAATPGSFHVAPVPVGGEKLILA